MDPITVVLVAALAAGVAQGVTAVGAQMIVDPMLRWLVPSRPNAARKAQSRKHSIAWNSNLNVNRGSWRWQRSSIVLA